MDPTNKPQGPSPHYSLYQREVFRKGGENGQRELLATVRTLLTWTHSIKVPSFSVHAEELADSTKKKLSGRGYFYANSNAGLGWTDRANR